MKRLLLILFSLSFCLNLLQAATICPDPNNSSLQWGEVPPPWKVNPFSPNVPQGEANAKFVRANIMVRGVGRGVICTYRNSGGDYSIWWQVPVKIPARSDYHWIELSEGFVCTESLTSCQFYAAA